MTRDDKYVTRKLRELEKQGGSYPRFMLFKRECERRQINLSGWAKRITSLEAVLKTREVIDG